MKEKGKAKMLIDDDFDFENDVSSNESLNDISNDESEMAKQLVYINDHKFNLIMKQQKRIAALEAENACLQICLNKETTKDQQIINNNAKRIHNSSSESNDTSEDDLKLISKKKSSKYIKSNHHSPADNECEVPILTINILY